MRDLPKISEAEYEVMKIVWEHAPIHTNGVVELLEKTNRWSPKTVQTLLRRLVKKGALSYKKESRSFVYMPLVKEEEYVTGESHSFLNRFYNGALNAMVLNFLDKDKLSKEDIQELRRILDEGQRKGEK
jgi:BlaI family penicillinase repressor